MTQTTGSIPPSVSFRRLRLRLALLTLLTHSLLVVVTLAYSAIADTQVYIVDDTPSYVVPAQNLVDHGVFSRQDVPPYEWEPYRLPGYPLLIAVGLAVIGQSWPALLFAPPLAALAAYALTGLAARLAASARVVALTGILMALLPNSLGLAGFLLTDAVGAYLAAAALCLTITAVISARWRWSGWAAAACWVVLQGMRPVFAPAGLLIAVVAVAQARTRRQWLLAAALIALTVPVPLALSYQNYRAHDAFTPSLLGTITTREYLFASVEAEATGRPYSAVRAEIRAENQRAASEDRPPGVTYVGYLYQLNEDQIEEVIDRHGLGLTLRVYAGELARQALAPWDVLIDLYYEPPVPWPLRAGLAGLTALFVLLAALGSALLWNRQREALLLPLWALYGFVLATGALSTDVGARLRLPADLALIPLVSVALDALWRYRSARRANHVPQAGASQDPAQGDTGPRAER